MKRGRPAERRASAPRRVARAVRSAVRGGAVPAGDYPRARLLYRTGVAGGGGVALRRRGQWFLFLVTFLFTVAFPLAKIAVCLALWAGPGGGGAAVKLAEWLSALSRWSMVDVFIVALVVLAVDGRVFGAADVHAGVIVFAAGVLLSTWAARRVVATAGG